MHHNTPPPLQSRGSQEQLSSAPARVVEFVSPIQRPLVIPFPAEANTPEKRIIYSLWRKGPQCYCELRLTTGLDRDEIKRALELLIRDNRILKEELPKADFLQNLGDKNDGFGNVSFRLPD